MISFDRKDVFLVTGASSGIGRETALLLNKLGAQVVAIARNEKKLQQLQEESLYKENCHIEVKDLVKDIEGLPRYVKTLKNKYGKFQGLAYCAGVAELAPLQTLDFSNMKNIFDINYFAPIFMIKGVADRRNNTGERASIVVVSSIAGLKSDKGHITYAGSKAAISASCKSISREIAGANVRLNCVSPSEVLTPMTADRIKVQEHMYPFGCGKAIDVASMIVFLLSKNSNWITSQNYVVDCGYM